MKGYKAFKKGLICKDKQYAENTVFEEEKAVICESGMHFCANPLDTLDYYPLIDENGDLTEFAEVEALDEVKTDDNKKYCTKKLKVGAKLTLDGFIKASFGVMFERTKKEVEEATKDITPASGDASNLAASGDESNLAASGYASNLAASGRYSNLAASGYESKLAASGRCSKLAASGDASIVESTGAYSVICCAGHGSIAKGKIGSWITLSEWQYSETENAYIPVCVKTERIDGERIKEDTFYKLENGEFIEVENG